MVTLQKFAIEITKVLETHLSRVSLTFIKMLRNLYNNQLFFINFKSKYDLAK